MSWADGLIKEQEAPFAKLTELLQLDYANFEYIVALEGADDVIFYNDLLETELGVSFLPFVCDNKDGVLNMKQACSSYEWAKKPKLIYICDKDFDDYLGKMVDGVYYTDHYSIESEITKGRMADYAIRCEVNPRPTPSAVKQVVSEFEAELQRLAQHMKRLSCLMMEIRNRDIHPDFDECSVVDFYTTTNDAIHPKDIDYDEILARWGVDRSDLIEASVAWESSLLTDDYRNWVRGKYLLQLARKILEVVLRKRWENSSRHCSAFLGKSAFKSVKVVFSEIPTLTQSIRVQVSGDAAGT